MLSYKYIQHLVAWLGVFLLLPPLHLEARTRKGDKFYKQAQAAELQGNFDKALDLYNQALSQDPADPAYQLGSRRVRFQVGTVHVQAGNKLRQDGKLDEALVEYQKALAIDPSSAIAIQEIQRTNEAIEQRKNGPPGSKPLSSSERAIKESEERIESLRPVPELRPITNQISTLKMNNQPPKVLYETVGKLAGINVIFDPQYQPTTRNVNLDLTNTTLDEALDYIALLTKTFWKPISSNAIFVTDDNVTKRRDYEDEVVKVFYLKNVTSVQEFQEIVTAVRSVTDIRRMFTYNAQNAVMARGTVDQINLAEKLFHDLDKAKSEVVIDVIIMEVNSSVMRNIGTGLSTNGLSVPLAFTPRNPVLINGSGSTGTGTGTGTGTSPSGATNGTQTGTTGTGTGTNTNTSYVALGQIGKIGWDDFSASLPGALLQATLSDSSTKIMQSPELRASDGQKVSLKIGEKVPYATGSYQPGVGTVGVSPLVSTQFQFADTGVNVELTPHVHGTGEVSMHIVVDVSNVSRTVSLGGLDQPVIAQRKNEADIRIKDGEVSLLGGLINNQDTFAVNGIPGLVNVPFGKYLFGSTSKDKERGNLLIALIPHIVRTPNVTGVDMTGVAAGTDQTVRLNYAPRKDEPLPAAPTPAAAPAPSPQAPPPAAPGGAARLTFNPPVVQAALSAPVVVTLQAENVVDLAAAPIRLTWDPKLLRLNSVTAGSLFTQGGAANAPSLDIRNDAGEATVGMTRPPGSAGGNGSGGIIQLTFMAIGKGSGAISVTEAGLKNSQQQPINAGLAAVPVTVQ